jgi:multiple antibiotic resistance protein
MPPFDALLNAFITLFVTVDPIGNAALFLGLTAGLSASIRRSVAVRGTAVAFAILSLFAVTGTSLLDAIGISIDAFRIAGGVLLFVTAFEMIYGARQQRREQASNDAVAEHAADLAVFPLAIPLLAGPGTISATILLSSELSAPTAASSWIGTASLIGVIGVLMIVSALILVAAEALDKYIGTTAKLVMTRLLGVLLAALAVQYIADGALAFAHS